MTGSLVVAEPYNALVEGDEDVTLSNQGDIKGNVVLIGRGHVPYFTKAAAAEAAGAIGVIIVNNNEAEPDAIEEDMPHPEEDADVWTCLDIPVVMISYNQGLRARELDTGAAVVLEGRSGLEVHPRSGYPTVSLRSAGHQPLTLRSGKVYYEVTLSQGPFEHLQIGWCDERCFDADECLRRVLEESDTDEAYGVGDYDCSWSVDESAQKHHRREEETWGKPWKQGDILGCMADLDAKTLSFSLNCSTDADGYRVREHRLSWWSIPRPSTEGRVTCNLASLLSRPSYLPDGYSPSCRRAGTKVSRRNA